MVCTRVEEDCVSKRYQYSYSVLFYKTTCYVMYSLKLTWLEAATECDVLEGSLATFDDVTTSNQVSYLTATFLHPDCAWVGLTKKFFYWKELLSKSAVMI